MRINSVNGYKQAGQWLWLTGLAACALLAGCAVAPTAQQQQLTAGFTAYRQRQYAAASGVAATYLKANPHGQNVAEAWYLRAIASEARGNTIAANGYFHRAILAAHNGPVARKSYHGLGDLAFSANDYALACHRYALALRAEPGTAAGAALLFHDAVALQNTGHWKAGRQMLKSALHARGAPQWGALVRQRLRVRAFTVQFGAYNAVAPAEQLVHTLHAAAIPAVVAPATVAGRRIFVVTAGRFGSYARAAGMHAAWGRQFPQSQVEAQ